MTHMERFSTVKIWIDAARPRTLILATATVLMGTFLAAATGAARWPVAIFSLITALWLQILSNLANDYGDAIYGVDHHGRAGPVRAVQSGLVPAGKMRQAIIWSALLAVMFGAVMLFIALGLEGFLALTVFFVLGLAAVWAAISYTAGNTHYGYAGFGDLAVLIFFGWVGVVGSYYLQVLTFDPAVLLPATSCGLLAVAVLNVNNIRDIESDRQVGKLSIPVRLGLRRARIYHLFLLGAALLAALIYVFIDFAGPWQFLFFLSLPLIIQNGLAVSRRPPAALDPFLKQMSLTTLVFVLAFGAGQILAYQFIA
jgi:1,4-dihydroxy-2-naphthoate octaprenyltransferase